VLKLEDNFVFQCFLVHYWGVLSLVRICFIALVVLGALNLSGCALALLGGAGAGGYYVGKDERTAGTIVDDATITGAIKSKMVTDGTVRALDFNVDTYRGVVTLYGSVPSYAEAQKAVTLAQSVEGVRSVISKITVVPNP
jgi:hyperosmotically inducible protein